jgi:hypothetical protein
MNYDAIITHRGQGFIIYSTRRGNWRSKKITRMSQAHLDAYAKYRPALIRKGGKP